MTDFFVESGMPEDMQKKIREEKTIKTKILVSDMGLHQGRCSFSAMHMNRMEHSAISA